MHWELSSSCLFFLAVFFFFLIIASDDCNMCVGLGWRTASTWYKILVALRFGLITVRSFFLFFWVGGGWMIFLVSNILAMNNCPRHLLF